MTLTVELWFAKIERDVIASSVFTSVSDLKRKLLRYVRQYNRQSKGAKWKYFDPTRRNINCYGINPGALTFALPGESLQLP